ncbi:phage integrase N-terminal SAM-like domain-containing protein [Neomoorella glycerini]|uniref:phage integrase N-terminal SAM-like domain-containing protein n=1 Tax=Neomoorella glycerini TaxID=55779 RepID=UPI003BF5E9E8
MEQGCTPGTGKGYLQNLQDFASWFEGTNGLFSPEAVTGLDLRDYQQHLLAVRGLKPGTINRRMAAIRKWMAWAVETGEVKEPLKFPKPVVESRKRRRRPSAGGNRTACCGPWKGAGSRGMWP